MKLFKNKKTDQNGMTIATDGSTYFGDENSIVVDFTTYDSGFECDAYRSNVLFERKASIYYYGGISLITVSIVAFWIYGLMRV